MKFEAIYRETIQKVLLQFEVIRMEIIWSFYGEK